MSKLRWEFSCFGVLTISCLLCLLIAFAAPLCSHGDRAYETEVKAGTHTIERALEKYHADKGEYPGYLLGGDKAGWDYYNRTRPDGAPELYDPLIEAGYLISYPVNPFIRSRNWGKERKDRKAINRFLEHVNGPDGGKFDPRFGRDGNIMGNVLSEPYILLETMPGTIEDYPRMCPGQFFYRAFGDVAPLDETDGMQLDNPDMFEYDSISHYLLGCFGSIRNPGLDAIRWVDHKGNLPEGFPHVFDKSLYLCPEGYNVEMNLRVPEVVGDGDSETLPSWPPVYPEQAAILYGAPDGIKDGIILCIQDPADEQIP